MTTRAQALVEIAIQAETASGPLADALRALAAQAAAPVTLVASPITTTYVGPNGSDVTGQRGDIGAPFLTIQKAIDMTLDGDIIDVSTKLAQAVYDEALVIPADRGHLTIRGVVGVVVQPAGAGTGLTWAPTVDGVLELENIAIFNSNPLFPSFHFDGSAARTTNLRATNCLFGGGAVFLQQIDIAQIQDSDILNNLAVEDCGFFQLRNSSAGDTRFSYDGAVATAPDRENYVVSASTLKAVFLDGHPAVKIGTSSLIEGAVTSSFSTFFLGPRDYSPNIEIEALCSSSSSVTLTFAASQVGPAASINRFNLSRGEFNNVTVTSQMGSPRSTAGYANNATFRGPFTVNNPETVCDARGSEFFAPPAGTGFLDRTFVPTYAQAVSALGTVIPISPPLTNNNYVVAVSPLSGAVNDTIVSAKTNASYTLTSAGGFTVDALVTLP